MSDLVLNSKQLLDAMLGAAFLAGAGLGVLGVIAWISLAGPWLHSWRTARRERKLHRRRAELGLRDAGEFYRPAGRRSS